MNVRAARPDFTRGLDEIDAVIIMFLNPRRNREDVGIEDDILRREANPGQEFVGALANLDFARPGVGLALFVERHDDDCRAIGHAFAGMVEELVLAFFHADRIDDRLARDAFEPRFDHRPFG